MNVPVHDKMMELYFKADEYIEEASCEQSMMSTSRRDYMNQTSESPLKVMQVLESEIPLDLSRINTSYSFDVNITHTEYNDDRLNSIRKEILEKEHQTSDKSSNKLSSVKKNQQVFDDPTEDLGKFNYSDDSDDGEFYSNDFKVKTREKTDVQDPMAVLFGTGFNKKGNAQETKQDLKKSQETIKTKQSNIDQYIKAFEKIEMIIRQKQTKS